jgi:uncharacterized protein (DUF1800 family)
LHESLWSFYFGKDPLSQYTEVDVIQAAKVLTGWRVVNLNTATPALILISIFMIRNKQFFLTILTIPQQSAGASELDALIDMIFTKSRSFLDICRRLYRYFIYYDIDSTIESNIIIPLARTFVANNWEIEPGIPTFQKPTFYDIQ